MTTFNPHPDADPDVARLGRLTVAAVGDVLDRLGLRAQVLDHRIRPVLPCDPFAGRAFTIAAVADDTILEHPYEHELAAVDAIPAGAVVLIATGGCCEAAVWGGLLTTRAVARGAVAAVSDGAVRDLAELRGIALPTFAAAISARDSCGRLLVTGFGEPVVCGGVHVASGDLVLGDEDGVVVVPADAADAVLAAAEEKLGLERHARASLEGGESASAMYERHGIL
jgi:4-hydroxy-4-methyl-2-oxoglutarate aldolase